MDSAAPQPFLLPPLPEDVRLYNRVPASGRYINLISHLLRENDLASFVKDAPPEFLAQLCAEARKCLEAEPVVLTIEAKGNEKIVLVGDLHGQFRDMVHNVLSIQLLDPQREERKILFLGDYVDRGPNGLETITLLLALKLEYPDLIFLIRGNHEEAQSCRMYGFLQECKSKLDIGVWQLFVTVFTALPLAAGVSCSGGLIFCAHGGLSPHTRAIEFLQFLNRAEYGELTLGNDDSETIDGLLWSDPSDRPGYKRNMRGCGFSFGQDASKEFCDNNRVKFICRAHQMVMNGYLWDHDYKVLTIFSAPNYCGINNNKGAIAILDNALQGEDRPIELQFNVYVSSPPADVADEPSSEHPAVQKFFASPTEQTFDPPKE